MSGKAAAAGGDTDFRKTWDKAEYAKKASDKDDADRRYQIAAEKAQKAGRKPPKREDYVPKPTEKMKRREASLELDKNVGKTFVVAQATGRGPGAPGWYCEVCNHTSRDSASYLGHVNGKNHLRKLGQTTKLERSTLDQVRAKIAELRERTAAASEQKAYDFDERIREIREAEKAARLERKAKKRRTTIEDAPPPDDAMAAMMGFSSFA